MNHEAPMNMNRRTMALISPSNSRVVCVTDVLVLSHFASVL
jgi:hypothetical protein